MKNSKGETLPQPYLDIARMRREQKPFDDAYLGFKWVHTSEGYGWWQTVFYSDFPPAIPAASLAELEEWRSNKLSQMASDAWIGKPAEPATDWKAKYEELTAATDALISEYNKLKDLYDKLDVTYQRLYVEHMKAGDPTRNLVAECAMRHYAFLGGDPIYSWGKAEAWAAEGRKRGHIN